LVTAVAALPTTLTWSLRRPAPDTTSLLKSVLKAFKEASLLWSTVTAACVATSVTNAEE
jgi:hypothetical protein